jgi:4-amino-4-deoxy-L-arabinose transferase-like glycosyltransferase
LLAVIIGVLALGFPYTHDEELYVTPARLAADQRLYADFFFHQTPYYPSILAPVLAAVESAHIFTAARLFSAFAGFLLMIVIYLTLREMSSDRFISLVLVAVVTLSPTMLPSFSVARNDSLAALFGTAAIYLLVRGLCNSRAQILPFAAGFLSGCVVLTKATWVFLPLCIGVFLVITYLRERHGSWVRLTAYVIGGVAATLPAVPIVLADPGTMFFDIAVFHVQATPDWYLRNGKASHFGHFDWPLMLYLYVRFLAQPIGALFLVAVVTLWGYGRRNLYDGLTHAVRNRSALLLLAICTLGAAAFALLPGVLSAYYFAPTVVMATLLVGAVLAHMRPHLTLRQRAALIVSGVLASAPGLASVAGISADLLRGTGGTQRIEKDAARLASHLCELDRPALVATLSPIRVLVAGHHVYPEFAAGPFVFRSAHLWTPEQLAVLHVAGRQTMDDLFDTRRPDAIYVGHERPWSADSGIELDGALTRWAVEHGYREFPFPGSKTKKTLVAPGVVGARGCRSTASLTRSPARSPAFVSTNY